MKKIINKKVYDTEKAKFIYKFESDLSDYVHTIYKKRTGEYFVHCIGYNSFGIPHETIDPVTVDSVKKMLSPSKYKEVYDKEFGIVDENVILSLSLTDENSKKVREFASKDGVSISAAVNAIISIYFECIVVK